MSSSPGIETTDGMETTDKVRNYLKFLRDAGFLYLVPSEKAEKAAASARQRAAKLEELRALTSQCTRCKLAPSRRHVVFGEGNPDADLVFVGEAPGGEEDVQGRPFVGRAGKLLDQMIVDAGLRREDVFICNVIKCRPPGNRDPETDEIESCEPYLIAQLELIQPRVIVTLGRFAAHTLLKVQTPIGKLRGQVYLYQGIKLVPTIHPAAVLRNINLRGDVEKDLRRAVEIVNEFRT
ncbi:uracil-DNA glycosylase [Candidatus Sumerlaeota bacterium]|nr:uracil-DNA glycosylase [Candidatus Sumerlaeota bacterium]